MGLRIDETGIVFSNEDEHMSTFLEKLRQQNAGAGAGTAGVENLSANTPFLSAEAAAVFGTEDLGDGSVPAGDPDVIVVVTPEDEAVNPDADIAEAGAIEALLQAEASAEQFGWSPSLLDYMSKQGLLNGTSLESASFESYSMEADGGEVGETAKAGIATRAKEWAGKLLGKIGGLWDQVSARFKKSQDEVEAAASGDVSSDSERKVIPYGKIAATVAGIAAAAGVIYVCAKHIDFKALQTAGGTEKAYKAIDDMVRKLSEKWPWGKIARAKALNGGGGKVLVREPGALIPKYQFPSMNEARSAHMAAISERRRLADAEWTKPALQSVSRGLSDAYSKVKAAVGGLYGAAKNPGAVVDAAISNPVAAAHTAGKGAVLAFVGGVIALVSWLLYHVVLKGASIVAGAVRSVTGGSKKED